MRTELSIMNRISILESRQPNKENQNIVKKLKRQLKKVQLKNKGIE